MLLKKEADIRNLFDAGAIKDPCDKQETISTWEMLKHRPRTLSIFVTNVPVYSAAGKTKEFNDKRNRQLRTRHHLSAAPVS